MLTLSKEEIREQVRRALAEDVGSGDVTTIATVSETSRCSARMVAREPMVVAGLALAEAAFHEVSPDIECESLVKDGGRARSGKGIMHISGPTRGVLTAERVALNFLQRLSGIATLTDEFVAAVRHTRARILDTRKTTPGLRRLEKYAVACGGGHNHRLGLHDQILIKDNHLVSLRDEKPNAIGAAVQRARGAYPSLKVEVEADSIQQVGEAIAAGADIILLDNMPPEVLKQAVALIGKRAITEASGGVTIKTVRCIAETGVDFISVGALTHSAKAMDIALDFE